MKKSVFDEKICKNAKMIKSLEYCPNYMQYRSKRQGGFDYE